MSETQNKVYDEGFQANSAQNTPSYSTLQEKLDADEAARHVSDEPDTGSTADKSESHASPEVDTGDDVAKPEEGETENDKRIARISFREREARNELRLAKEQIARLTGSAPSETPEQKAERLVNERATQIANQKVFNAHCDDIHKQGVKEFPDFDNQLRNLHNAGIALSYELIEAATEVGDPQKLLHYLGKNIDEAERISALAPHRMGAALAKLQSKVSPPKMQSKAPAPIKPIQGKSSPVLTDEEMPLADYIKREDAKLAKSGGRRYT